MPVYTALLQGVNIGSKKRIKMDALRSLVTDAGGSDVRTYVNSGNVVFRHDETNPSALETRLETALRDQVGMDVPTIIRTTEELDDVIADNPFPEAVAAPKTLHALFLREKPAVEDIDAVDEIETGPDRLAIHGRTVYFFLPNLMSGATVDVAKVGKMLRVDGTSRNWNTVTKLAAMAHEKEAPDQV
jgi:uncharacterized protein (DUF1697 family)